MMKKLLCALLTASLLLVGCSSGSGEDKEAKASYEEAMKAYEEENFLGAVSLFKAAGDYKDAKDKKDECYFKMTEKYFNEGNYITPKTFILSTLKYEPTQELVKKTLADAVNNEDLTVLQNLNYILEDFLGEAVEENDTTSYKLDNIGIEGATLVIDAEGNYTVNK